MAPDVSAIETIFYFHAGGAPVTIDVNAIQARHVMDGPDTGTTLILACGYSLDVREEPIVVEALIAEARYGAVGHA